MGGRRSGVPILSWREGVIEGETEEEDGCESVWKSAFQGYLSLKVDGPTRGSLLPEGSVKFELIELEALKVNGNVDASPPLSEVAA